MPTVTDRLVHVHMPKTGGAALALFLRQHCKGQPALEQHSPAADLTLLMRQERTVFGVLRNPWIWYYSWYQHCLRSERREYLLAYGEDFRQVLHSVTHPSPPYPFTRPGIFWGPKLMNHWEALAASNCGLYSWAARAMFGRQMSYHGRPAAITGPFQPAVDALLDTARMDEGLRLLDAQLPAATIPHHNVGDYQVDLPKDALLGCRGRCSLHRPHGIYAF